MKKEHTKTLSIFLFLLFMLIISMNIQHLTPPIFQIPIGIILGLSIVYILVKNEPKIKYCSKCGQKNKIKSSICSNCNSHFIMKLGDFNC